MSRTIPITAAVVACALGLGLHRPVPAQQAGGAWDNVRAYTAEKRNEALAYGKKLVRETDAKIRELERQAAKSTGEAKAVHQQNVEELKDKRAQAAAKLDEMGNASGAAWDATKQGFADAYRDLHGAYQRAVAQFRK